MEGVQLLLVDAIHPCLCLCHTPQSSCVGGGVRSRVNDWWLFDLDGGVDSVDVQGDLGEPRVDVVLVLGPFTIGNGGGDSLLEEGDWECHFLLVNDVEVATGAPTSADR